MTCIASKVLIWSVLAFSGNQTHDFDNDNIVHCAVLFELQKTYNMCIYITFMYLVDAFILSNLH